MAATSVFDKNALKGRIAFITGGGSGICYGIAEKFMQHGCRTVIVSRKLERLQQAAKELETKTGQQCVPIAMDVRDVKQIEQAVDKALAAFGRIDILVNGAAGNFLVPASQLSTNALNTVFQIDAIGTFSVSRIVYTKWMQKNGGAILNITATLHWNGEFLQLHAGAAKAAVEAMALHMCNEWGRNKVRVNNLAPGPIENTEGFSRLGGFLPEAMLQNMTKRIPLQRMGTTDDVASAALFLCSDAASYISGTTVVVDGGAWMGGAGYVAQQMPDMLAKL